MLPAEVECRSRRKKKEKKKGKGGKGMLEPSPPTVNHSRKEEKRMNPDLESEIGVRRMDGRGVGASGGRRGSVLACCVCIGTQHEASARAVDR